MSAIREFRLLHVGDRFIRMAETPEGLSPIDKESQVITGAVTTCRMEPANVHATIDGSRHWCIPAVQLVKIAGPNGAAK